MRSAGEVAVTSWRARPVETRWGVLNWPAWARLLVLSCFFVLLNWLIFAPASSFPSMDDYFAHQDKVAHGAMFLALAFLVRWSFPAGAARDRLDGWPRYGVPLALVLYACSAEVLQPLFGGAGRQFEWLDMASNVTGVSAGWLFFGAAIAGADDIFTKRAGAGSDVQPRGAGR